MNTKEPTPVDLARNTGEFLGSLLAEQPPGTRRILLYAFSGELIRAMHVQASGIEAEHVADDLSRAVQWQRHYENEAAREREREG